MLTIDLDIQDFDFKHRFYFRNDSLNSFINICKHEYFEIIYFFVQYIFDQYALLLIDLLFTDNNLNKTLCVSNKEKVDYGIQISTINRLV